jgi:predicted RNA-binding protein YlxR (DUF448 family)
MPKDGDIDVNPRTCIVSRQPFDRDELIRFVAGPDGNVVPDLKETLPGRGVRVEATRQAVQTAVEKQMFARGLKTGVKADPALADLVDGLLEERALQALALAKKAGLLVTGFAKVDAAIRSNKADLLMHSTDAADDGKRKLASAAAFVKHLGGEEINVVSCLGAEQMSAVLGLGNVNHVAALPGGATRNLMVAISKLQKYRV